MLNRRAFLYVAIAFSAPLIVEAQPSTKQVRIALLSPSPPMSPAAALSDELRTLGYVEGRNLTIDYRWALPFERLAEEANRTGPNAFGRYRGGVHAGRSRGEGGDEHDSYHHGGEC